MTDLTKSQIGLRIFSKVVCFATLLLVFIGGMVTSTNSGLSVPDWPTTYGQNMFAYPVSAWRGGIIYEHGHRLVASVVGFCVLVLAFWIPLADRRPWLRLLGFAALSAVVLQGLLGGLTVLLKIPPPVSILHGVLAQTFFVITIVVAYSLSAERDARGKGGERDSSGVTRLAILVSALVYIQLILGAVMRHTHSGLAIPDFPRMGGMFLPAFDQEFVNKINSMRAGMSYTGVTMAQIAFNFIHRIGALLVTIAAVVLNFRAARVKPAPVVMRTLWLFNALLLAQWTLAAFTIWTQKSPVVTSFHVAVGASLLGMSTLLALRAAPVSRPVATKALPAVAGVGQAE